MYPHARRGANADPDHATTTHVIHGTYRIWPRRHAFRNDYCLSCDAPRPAEQISSLVVLHVYWIPLIPLGRWKHWACEVCGQCPCHDSKGRSFTATLCTALCIAAIAVWIAAFPPNGSLIFWTFPAGVLALATLTMMARRAGTQTRYRNLFATVVPADDEICPYCTVALVSEFNECRCPSCRVRRL